MTAMRLRESESRLMLWEEEAAIRQLQWLSIGGDIAEIPPTTPTRARALYLDDMITLTTLAIVLAHDTTSPNRSSSSASDLVPVARRDGPAIIWALIKAMLGTQALDRGMLNGKAMSTSSQHGRTEMMKDAQDTCQSVLKSLR